MRARGWLAAMGLVGSTACSADPYACVQDSQCVRDEAVGMCVDPGFCAYADEDCPSGVRFSPHAGERAGQCVQLDTATSDGSSEGSDSSGEVAPGCGNGQLEADETCDDGNAIDGDGCSSTCVRAGTLRWIETIAGPTGDGTVALALRPGGGVVVAAELGDTEGDRSAHVQALAEDGSTMASWTDEPSDRRLHGLGLHDDAVMLAGDEPSAGATGTRAWAVILGAALDAGTPFVIDTLGEDTGRGAVGTARGLALVGTQDGVAAARFLQTGGPDWREEPVASVDAVAGRSDGSFVVVGTTDGGVVRWWVVSPQGATLGEGDTDIDDVRAAGFVGTGQVVLAGVRAGEPWAATYALDGSLAWDVPGQDSTGTVDAVALVPGGDVIFAGNDGDFHWVLRVGPEPEIRWGDGVLEEESGARLLAVAHDEQALYVAGTRPGSSGLDVFVAALQP